MLKEVGVNSLIMSRGHHVVTYKDMKALYPWIQVQQHI